jgi:hypothetical protein
LLLIDGATFANVSYGRPRPQECTTMPDVRACPNIGFDYSLDTTRLTNGPHTLQVYVFNDRFVALAFPQTLSYGIQIFVQNP